jgi:hypothetical protein
MSLAQLVDICIIMQEIEPRSFYLFTLRWNFKSLDYLTKKTNSEFYTDKN